MTIGFWKKLQCFKKNYITIFRYIPILLTINISQEILLKNIKKGNLRYRNYFFPPREYEILSPKASENELSPE